MKTARIRRDIIRAGLTVPTGHGYLGNDKPYQYRWTGKGGSIFQVLYRGNWNTAESIDFEFN